MAGIGSPKKFIVLLLTKHVPTKYLQSSAGSPMRSMGTENSILLTLYFDMALTISGLEKKTSPYLLERETLVPTFTLTS